MKHPPLLLIGLTGGIAAGKSSFARMLEKRGARLLDADQAARDVVRPGEPCLAEVISLFGRDYLTDAGELDRTALAELISRDAGARRRLNRVTHPRIAAELLHRVRGIQARPPKSRVVVLEAALLVEAGWGAMVDLIAAVSAPRQVRIERLMARDGVNEEAAARKVDMQSPDAYRLRAAQFLVDGAATPSAFRLRADDLWSLALQKLEKQPTGKGESKGRRAEAGW